MELIFRGLLIFTPLAAYAAWHHASPVYVFILSAIAIIPLAKFIGDGTEQLSLRTTPAVGGLLNATFGNATELIIGILALHDGLIEVVKASITGSILGNLLLVLGMSMLAGGWKRERQEFNATAAKASCSMLILATIALVIPTIFFTTSDGSAHAEAVLSYSVAILMIIAYGASLLFSLHTHKHLYQAADVSEEPRWSVRKAILVLAASTAVVAVLSELLVRSLTPLITTFGWNQLFIGVVVVAIVGNAAEHVTAIQAARKNHISLSLSIAIGSATQIIMFVAPVLVLVSAFFLTPMNLVFNLFELVALIFCVFVTNAVVEDGVSNWLEGFQLLIAYVIMAVAFFFHT